MYLTFVTFFSWFFAIDVPSELPVNIYNETSYITFGETELLHVVQVLLLLFFPSRSCSFRTFRSLLYFPAKKLFSMLR